MQLIQRPISAYQWCWQWCVCFCTLLRFLSYWLRIYLPLKILLNYFLEKWLNAVGKISIVSYRESLPSLSLGLIIQQRNIILASIYACINNWAVSRVDIDSQMLQNIQEYSIAMIALYPYLPVPEIFNMAGDFAKAATLFALAMLACHTQKISAVKMVIGEWSCPSEILLINEVARGPS